MLVGKRQKGCRAHSRASFEPKIPQSRRCLVNSAHVFFARRARDLASATTLCADLSIDFRCSGVRFFCDFAAFLNRLACASAARACSVSHFVISLSQIAIV